MADLIVKYNWKDLKQLKKLTKKHLLFVSLPVLMRGLDYRAVG